LDHNQIFALEPGYGLDYAVARNVMGWNSSGGSIINDGGLYVAKPNAENQFQQMSFRPSTNILDAWEVVEKMNKTQTVSVYSDNNGKWACEIGYIVWDDFDTAPEAICKAALAAIEPTESA
jgi:hypothetical protein